MALSTVFQEKIPPQSLEAEESVLGASMLDQDAIDVALSRLKADDFYHAAHRRIFDAITQINGRSEPVDLVTVTEFLKKKNELDSVGGSSFIASLTDKVPSSANVEFYANIVRDKARLRRLITACGTIIGDCYRHEKEAPYVVDTAENLILQIGSDEGEKRVVPIQDRLMAVIGLIEDRKGREEISGIATGFHELDQLTDGMHGGELIIVAGRPGMGKTAFCMNIARNVALSMKDGKPQPVAVFSVEMATDSLLMRLLCTEALINAHKVRRGSLQQFEMGKLVEAASRLFKAPIFIDDRSKLDIQTLRASLRRLKREQDIKLAVVDYLQIMDAAGMGENRQTEITHISRGLKALAKEMNIPIVVASQLRRAETGKESSRPKLSDLRESGSIEQEADVVILIDRKQYHEKQTEDLTANIDVAKQRNGPTGEVELIFRPEYTKFEDKAPDFQSPA
ncbi:MAG: replicative DNA helicase [candidate division FCPU426 bacterium]